MNDSTSSTASNSPPGRLPLALLDRRLPLAVLTRSEVIGLAFTALLFGMIFALFHFMGNTVENVNSRSAFVWMIYRWGDTVSYGGADYSHGKLIPLVTLALLWYRRREILSAPRSMNRFGLVLIFGALLMHWTGAKMQQTRLSLFALIGLLWAIPFHLFGWSLAKHLLFPVAYLIFCIPLTFLDTISFPLRMFATSGSVAVLNGIGIQTVQVGTAIHSAAGSGFKFDVADPCSGLRSLLAMTALTAVYANVTQNAQWKKWLLFAASIPLAIIGNVARIFTVALVAEAFGDKLALGLYHDYSGYVVFTVAILFMIGIGSLLSTDLAALKRRFRTALSQTTETPGPRPA
ncbi:MAG: exosortase/archaeosortase family protein [Kiritimatiellia bacterium]|nr:exosortase/archaeosortase family protein [Kiritimatiellia bacterium]